MLIIEGSDCLGKTTFANLLVAEAAKRKPCRYPIFYSHMSRPNDAFDFFDHYYNMITTFAVQDRFHIGGIVWHDRIPEAELSIIEGWLRCEGSMTVVLYASDQEWYEKRIKEDTRGNMLGFEAMRTANILYSKMARRNKGLSFRPIIDYGFDINPQNVVCDPEYPDAEYANHILDKWFERLRLLET